MSDQIVMWIVTYRRAPVRFLSRALGHRAYDLVSRSEATLFRTPEEAYSEALVCGIPLEDMAFARLDLPQR